MKGDTRPITANSKRSVRLRDSVYGCGINSINSSAIMYCITTSGMPRHRPSHTRYRYGSPPSELLLSSYRPEATSSNTHFTSAINRGVVFSIILYNSDVYFGACPECKKPGIYLNVFKDILVCMRRTQETMVRRLRSF
jgi:hypothetical protein